MTISEIFSIMSATLGDALIVFGLFISMMLVGGLLGRLVGGFKEDLNTWDIIVALSIIVAFSAVVGWRFADAGIELIVGFLNAVLMLIAFGVGVILLPFRRKTTQSNDGWGHLPTYDDQGRPRT